jgi:hypothetical protein
MVDAQIFKDEIRKLVSQQYELKFLGGNDKFENIVAQLSQSKADDIYNWIRKIISTEIRPISTASKKKYKDWQVRELLAFRKELSINGIEYRILFIKVKNSFYIEFHLGDHKYYDSVRKHLDLKKSSY